MTMTLHIIYTNLWFLDVSLHTIIFSFGPRQAKIAFEHAQNAQNTLRMRMVSSGPLLSIHISCSIQWLCKRKVKVLIRLRSCAVWSGPSLSAHAKTHFRMTRPIYYIHVLNYRNMVISRSTVLILKVPIAIATNYVFKWFPLFSE